MSAAQRALTPMEDVLERLRTLEQELADTKAEVLQLKQHSATDIAFTAQLTTPMTNLGSKQTIKFDRVITNIGSGYNPLTGVFTCPCDGNYVFTATLMCFLNTFNELVLMVNGVKKMFMYTGSNEGRHNQGTNSIVLQLKSSDLVWIETGGYPATSSVYGKDWSSFTGFKLR